MEKKNIGEEKYFDVELVKVDSANELQIIKIVRQLTGFGLKETKDIVENPPKTLNICLSKDEVDKVKADLESLGVKVNIKVSLEKKDDKEEFINSELKSKVGLNGRYDDMMWEILQEEDNSRAERVRSRIKRD